MMREGYMPPPVDLRVLSGQGGLGDTLARLPAFKYINENQPWVTQHIYIQDGWMEIVNYLLPPNDKLKYSKLSEAPFYLKKPYVEFNNERLTTLHLHLTDHAFLIMMDMLPPRVKDKAYWGAPFVHHFTKYRKEFAEIIVNGKAIVFTTDYTAPVRQWPAVHINNLARKCLAAGLQPVLLGVKDKNIASGLDYDPVKVFAADGLETKLFVDLRDKTTLVEALGVMQRAKAVVGVDNGLLHLAHYTDTPVVIGYTSLKAQHRLPFRYNFRSDIRDLTKAIEADVPCQGCQSNSLFMNYDRRTCLHKDYACLLTLTADKFYAKLQELNVVPRS